MVVGVVVAGFFAPNLYLYQRAYDRSARMQRELPDAIDLLTISVESGLGFDAAVQQVAHNTEGPLADEFSRVLREMQIGSSPLRGAAGAGRAHQRRRAAHRSSAPWCRPTPSASPSPTCCASSPSEMRVKRRQRAEEKAQQVPVKMTIPLIFCILPSLFIVIMGPAVIQIMDSFSGL